MFGISTDVEYGIELKALKLRWRKYLFDFSTIIMRNSFNSTTQTPRRLFNMATGGILLLTCLVFIPDAVNARRLGMKKDVRGILSSESVFIEDRSFSISLLRVL